MNRVDNRPRATLERWPARIRELEVLRVAQVTPRMRRLVLGGPNVEGFESHISDEHAKLLFPSNDSELARIPKQDGDRLSWPRPLVPARDYTVRRYDASHGEVTVDFAQHEGGLASAWASCATAGATVWVAGPPRGIRVPDTFTWRAHLADEIGLPALARILEELPATTLGLALIEVADDDEVQDLACPAGVEVRWLTRGGRPAGTPLALVEEATAVPIPQGGGAYVWFGGESGAIKPLRSWVKAAGLGQGEFDLTGYWRKGAKGNQLTLADVGQALKHLARRDY